MKIGIMPCMVILKQEDYMTIPTVILHCYGHIGGEGVQHHAQADYPVSRQNAP